MAPGTDPDQQREFASLCERFAAVRKQLDLTQEEFADAIGVSRSHVAEIETYRTDPSLRAIQGLLRMDLVLGPLARPVEPRWLHFGDGEMFGPRRRDVWDEAAPLAAPGPDVPQHLRRFRRWRKDGSA